MLQRPLSIACSAMALALSAAPSYAQNGGRLASDRPAQMRLTPAEIAALPAVADRAAATGAQSIESRIVKGDPSKLGLYTIVLNVPAHTRIEAHAHPDERVATVISGTWYVGYGDTFDESALKALPPGSFYTEPATTAHFARTGDEPAVIRITGVGPTGTAYAAPAHRKFDSDR